MKLVDVANILFKYFGIIYLVATSVFSSKSSILFVPYTVLDYCWLQHIHHWD